MQDKIIFEEQDGSTNYSITKGIFYIPDLHSKHLAYKVMKHIKFEKPIIEYCWDKIKAETVLKGLMTDDELIKHTRINPKTGVLTFSKV
jgi:hypothetical protein